MNIRKNIDYSEMYEALDKLMVKQLLQMELYCEIGKVVCRRTEKGAAVIASEYLNKQYPDVKGFSPRSLRRMRNFYYTYENYPALLSRAMKLGWIQNVIIMEADLTMELREWYMKAAKQYGWSKTELIANIATNAHESIALAIEEVRYNNVDQENHTVRIYGIAKVFKYIFQYIIPKYRILCAKKGRRRWYNLCPMITENRIVFVRC
jgi:hypothetical protein